MSEPARAAVVLDDTRRWLERAVIGLNLCPFAKSVYVKDQVHFVVCDAPDASGVLSAVERELDDLARQSAQARDTTLIMLTQSFSDFLEFNDFCARADRLVRRRGWEGVFQVASFHPDFQFAGTEPDDIENASNRSPYPTLHLLREESIDRAVAAFPEAEAIFQANIDRLRALGHAGWQALNVGRS